jgi:probable F420-dependent oxidoreductase
MSAMKLDAPLYVAAADAAASAPILAEVGFDGAFAFEGPEDLFIPLSRAAGTTSLDLYSNVAISFPRSPMHLAQTAWDLQRFSGGRFLLGLGSQVRAHVERRFGAEFSHPVERMADQVQAIHAIFRCWADGTPLDHDGPYWKLDLMPPLFRPVPLEGPPPPVLVAAVGPRMTAMATALADGVILHPFTTTSQLHERSLAAVHAGLAAAGRSLETFTTIAGTMVAVGADAAEQRRALEAARGLVGFYGSTPAYRGTLEHLGRGDLQPTLRDLTRSQRWDELAGLVDDDLVREIAICGGPDEVAAQLVERGHGHVDRVAITFASGAGRETLAALVEGVRRRIVAAPGGG